MKRGWVAVYRGPQQDAEEVQAVLRAQSIDCEVLGFRSSGVAFWAPGQYDARVFVPVGQLRRSRELLRRNPRWKPVEEKAELAEARQNYRTFLIAGTVLGFGALVLIAGLWIGAL